MKKVAVVLSGSGFLDGSEIHEATLTLLYLSQAGVEYECLAPDCEQHHVINHINQEAMAESRNILVESARIARGNIKPLNQANLNDYSAVIFPGGFGAAKNLCDFAIKGANFSLQSEVLTFGQAACKAKLPMGFICIAPIMITKLCGPNITLTLGNDPEIIETAQQLGAKHTTCQATEIAVDHKHQIVSTPAYMVANNIAEAAAGIEKLVKQVVAFAAS